MSSVNDLPPAGKPYWRSLDGLADTPEYRRYVEREFPYLETDGTGVNRRQFLTIMSASMALGGLTACRRPAETIVPYVKAPEEVIPGIPNHFTTTMPFGEQAFGLVATSHEGRPTKLEGNDLHPVNRGKSNAWIQAEILNLYDPDRVPRVMHGGQPASWAEFVAAIQTARTGLAAAQGQGLAVLSQASSSPTLARLAARFRETYPQAMWAVYEPVTNEDRFEGARLGCGESLRPIYHLDQADVMLAVDCDFLLTEDDSLRHARDFAVRRNGVDDQGGMNRLHAAESTFTITGAMADHRLRLQRSLMPTLLIAIARELGVEAVKLDTRATAAIDAEWVRQVATDLRQSHGRSVVLGGRALPAAAHALIMAINDKLGAIGGPVTYVEPQDSLLPSRGQLAGLVQAIEAGSIHTLLVLGGDPVYNAPADVPLAAALGKVALTVHHGLHLDATSAHCTWHVPSTHFLEEWGDARACEGTLGVTQPLIAPLYADAHSAIEVVNLLVTGEDRPGYELVRAAWQEAGYLDGGVFDSNWRRVLHDGVLPGSAWQQARVVVNHEAIGGALGGLPGPVAGFEVTFHLSSSLHDGRYANNGWLQEAPDPVTKLTWDNAAIVSPRDAEKLGLRGKLESVSDLGKLGRNSYPMVMVTVGGRSLELPVFVLPGQAENSIAIELGYGRTCGRVAEGAGRDTYQLRTSSAPNVAAAEVRKTAGTELLAVTQDHSSMENRPLIRETTLAAWNEGEHELYPEGHQIPLNQLWKSPADYSTGYQWAMSIDLNTCIGCNACLVACQSENNIPIVGKDQVSRAREMHWIRIDRYFAGQDVDNPEMRVQPVPCQHCENAPCEQVCPVQATAHDKEGLNAMAYNRCIGTRYCANNCPYKVRRFNFFNYTKKMPETVQLQQNPNVTVRFRGVMEKCTYCTQRINHAKIAAKVDNRELKDGDVQTACQQACPVNAISFGNQLDATSQIARQQQKARNYTILTELNVRPRTSYLGRITNPQHGAGPHRQGSTGDHGQHEEAN